MSEPAKTHIHVQYQLTSTYVKVVSLDLLPDDLDHADLDAIWDWLEAHPSEAHMDEVDDDNWVDADPGSIQIDGIRYHDNEDET